ncbi:MAG: glutaredoxin domain-containing protein [Nitrospira sp.]|nr:glutaredoxin domain-containing protein [Nitrospira sp.]
MNHRDTRWSGLIRRAAIGCALFLISFCGVSAQSGEPAPDLEVFVRSGCPHCEVAQSFLADIRQTRPGLRIVVYDIAEDSLARRRLSHLGTEQGLGSLGVPAFLIGSELIIGFQSADTTGKEILARLDHPPAHTVAPTAGESIQSRWLGELRVTDLGLPLFTITIGLLDGFNPCAMWVLLFLLSLLVNLQDRRKMALIAGTFVLVSGLVYFAFMAAWLNIFLLIGLSRAVQIGLGCIAFLIGSVNVKDFFALHRGLSLSIPESAKPGLYARTRQILQAEHLASALAGVVVLAGFVNVVELLCTAGFPALYTQILTMQQMPAWKYYAYLGLYNLAYVFDDSLMVIIAVITLSRTKLQERAGRWLKLTSGLVMVGLGAILLLQPKWLP